MHALQVRTGCAEVCDTSPQISPFIIRSQRQIIVNTYCVGDVQGCFEELNALLEAIHFDPARDQLILLGDIINRGPKSVQTLRLAKELGAACKAILGNHDLSILAKIRAPKIQTSNKTVRQIIDANDAAELLQWLESQDLAIQKRCESGDFLLVHAGLAPQWSVAQTLQYAQEVSQVLRGPGRDEFLHQMFGDEPRIWSDSLQGIERLRFITNCLTRLRYCNAQGQLALERKSDDGRVLEHDSQTLMPWFAVPGRASANHNILFGHWSRLSRVHWPQYRVWGLDTGCVWGERLTALHLETLRLIQAPART